MYVRIALYLVIFVSCHIAANAGILVIAYMDESKAALMDSDTGATLAVVDTGKNPHEVRVSPDKRRAYVAAGRTITAIDIRARRVMASFDLGDYSAHDIRISRNGRTIWAACARSKAILEMDANTGKILKNYDTGAEGSWFVEISPDEKKLYTPNLEGKSVSVIDRATRKVTVIPFDHAVYGIDITPDGKQVWVSGGDPAVIDTATDSVIGRIKTSEQETGRIRLTANGRKLVVALSKTVEVYDVKSRRLIGKTPLGAEPKVMTLSRDGRRAFLTNPADNSVSVVDIVSGKQVSRFVTGKKPDGIGWAD